MHALTRFLFVVALSVSAGCSKPSEYGSRADRVLDQSTVKTKVVRRTESDLGATYRLANPDHAPIESVFLPPAGYVSQPFDMPASERTFDGPAPDRPELKCRIGVIDRPEELIVDVGCLY